jgi:phage shock protein PspC (stress-responsive transcriptional regulator)
MTNLETEPATLPPPTPTTPPPERRWARSDDRIVLGVAGGLGRALAVDPLLVRIVFVVLGLFSGVGILFYVAALALLADSPTSPPTSTIRRIAGGVVALIAARVLLDGDAQLPDAGWVVALGLLGAAVALWRGRAPEEMRSAPPEIDVQADADGGSTSDGWNTLIAKRRERPRPPRSPLGLLTIGAATVVGALVWLLGGNADDRGALAFGLATIVLGAGLVVGAFAGRARWLVVPALGTAAAAVIAAALGFAGVGLDHRSGDRTEFIQAEETVAPLYRTGIGSFELDFSNDASDASTEIDVGVGDLTVVVPDDAHVQIDARIGLGEINAFGSTRSGYRRALSTDYNTDGARMIKLKLRVGVGSIEVRRGFFESLPIVTAPAFLPDIPALQYFGDGTVLFEDNSIDFGDGRRIEADGSYQIPIVEQFPDGAVRLDNGAQIRADGTVLTPGGFVIPRQDTPPLATTTTSSTIAVTEPVAATTTPTTATSEVQP